MHLVGVLGTVTWLGERRFGLLPRNVQRGHGLLNLPVAFLHTALIEIVERERLCQDKDMLGLIVPHEGGTDRLDPGLTARVAHGRQNVRITLARDNGTNHLHARCPGHVANDMVQLQIHDGQCLLHVLDMCRSIVQMALT